MQKKGSEGECSEDVDGGFGRGGKIGVEERRWETTGPCFGIKIFGIRVRGISFKKKKRNIASKWRVRSDCLLMFWGMISICKDVMAHTQLYGGKKKILNSAVQIDSLRGLLGIR